MVSWPDFSGTEWQHWLGAVGIPYLALFALAAIEGRGSWPSISRQGIEMGIDACILGLGVCGALFASDQVRRGVGPDLATPLAVALIFVDLIITGLCLHLRKQGSYFTEAARARLSIFLGVVILIINSFIVIRYGRT